MVFGLGVDIFKPMKRRMKKDNEVKLEEVQIGIGLTWLAAQPLQPHLLYSYIQSTVNSQQSKINYMTILYHSNI